MNCKRAICFILSVLMLPGILFFSQGKSVSADSMIDLAVTLKLLNSDGTEQQTFKYTDNNFVLMYLDKASAKKGTTIHIKNLESREAYILEGLTVTDKKGEQQLALNATSFTVRAANTVLTITMRERGPNDPRLLHLNYAAYDKNGYLMYDSEGEIIRGGEAMLTPSEYAKPGDAVYVWARADDGYYVDDIAVGDGGQSFFHLTDKRTFVVWEKSSAMVVDITFKEDDRTEISGVLGTLAMPELGKAEEMNDYGAAADFTVDEDAPFIISDATWKIGGTDTTAPDYGYAANEFDEDGLYFADITLYPKKGYKFTENTEINISGAEIAQFFVSDDDRAYIRTQNTKIPNNGKNRITTKCTTYNVDMTELATYQYATCTADNTYARSGDIVTLKAYPGTGCLIQKITIKDSSSEYDLDLSKSPLQFTMGDSATEVLVTCKQIGPNDPRSIIVNYCVHKEDGTILYDESGKKVEGGTVSVNKTKGLPGDTIELTVIPNDGFYLYSCEVGDGGQRGEEIKDTLTFTVWDKAYDMVVDIIFKEDSRTIIEGVDLTVFNPQLGQTTLLTEGDDAGNVLAGITPERGAKYTATHRYWFESTSGTEKVVPTEFLRGKYYYAEFDLTPNDGYVFSRDLFINLNHGEVDSVKTFPDGHIHVVLKKMMFAPPPETTGLKAVGDGKSRVKLTWNETEDVDGYLIYGIHGSDGKYGYIGMTTLGTTFTDTKAFGSDFNFYWVFPYITDNNGKMIPGVCAKYVYAKASPLPAVLNLKASSLTGAVSLTWTAVEGAEGYLIYGKRGANGAYGYIGMTTQGTQYKDTKAISTDYNFYWVFAYYKDSNGKMVAGLAGTYTYGRPKQ
ncbi:MAG: hypothetical protein IKZ90_03455 [Clostridiales bacterium]|nr:hypothetical protein [Clostridiales bacterium]